MRLCGGRGRPRADRVGGGGGGAAGVDRCEARGDPRRGRGGSGTSRGPATPPYPGRAPPRRDGAVPLWVPAPSPYSRLSVRGGGQASGAG